MNQTELLQIEQTIMRLSTDEQLLLISRVAEKLRKKAAADFEFESKLAEMADDADIRRELKNIEEDFRYTELDGFTQ